MPEQTIHPWCAKCGWAKGGLDSWNGRACKCGLWEPPITRIDEPPSPPTSDRRRGVK